MPAIKPTKPTPTPTSVAAAKKAATAKGVVKAPPAGRNTRSKVLIALEDAMAVEEEDGGAAVVSVFKNPGRFMLCSLKSAILLTEFVSKT